MHASVYNRRFLTGNMNGPVLRILDANANRAREALRVIEDYARFVLDNDQLSASLKTLRHDFAQATGGFVAEAVLHRDTPGDVGTRNKTTTEQTREDVAHVVVAAGKRLGEALRTIEEYLKTADPPRAHLVEEIRYRFYDVEQRIALTVRPAACAFARVRLYVLITESVCKRDWREVAREAIAGGADCLQLREKHLEGGAFLARAREFVDICRAGGVISIINDRPDVALLAGADGVHVGQGDLPAREVRKLIGNRKLLGVSTHDLEQAKRAVTDGADYIGVGPFFRSATKTRDFVAGAAVARQVAENVTLPAVAIAGINEQNVDEVLAAGINAIAVTAAICAADDPRVAAERLKAKLTSSPSPAVLRGRGPG